MKRQRSKQKIGSWTPATAAKEERKRGAEHAQTKAQQRLEEAETPFLLKVKATPLIHKEPIRRQKTQLKGLWLCPYPGLLPRTQHS